MSDQEITGYVDQQCLVCEGWGTRSYGSTIASCDRCNGGRVRMPIYGPKRADSIGGTIEEIREMGT